MADSIKAIRKKAKKLEEKMKSLIVDFEESTGLKVDWINIVRDFDRRDAISVPEAGISSNIKEVNLRMDFDILM